MIQQARQTPDDRQPQPETFVAITLRIFDLKEFVKNPLAVARRNAGAGVPDFDPPLLSRAPAADQNTPMIGVTDRIGDEIAQDSLDQDRIRIDKSARGMQDQRQTFLCRFLGIFPTYALE